MFCFQCEQTKRGRGVAACVVAPATCGKEPTTADLQDLLVHAVQGHRPVRDPGPGPRRAGRRRRRRSCCFAVFTHPDQRQLHRRPGSSR